MDYRNPQNPWQVYLPPIPLKADRRVADSSFIYGHYTNEAGNTHFFVAEGNPLQNGDYLYWGFAVLPDSPFPRQLEVRASQLETGKWPGKAVCLPKTDFIQQRWVELKAKHFPPTQPIRAGRATRD
jgi:hypothetical protein